MNAFTMASSTYDHRVWKTGLPVRSAVLKPHAGQLVVGWVTTSESWLLGTGSYYSTANMQMLSTDKTRSKTHSTTHRSTNRIYHYDTCPVISSPNQIQLLRRQADIRTWPEGIPVKRPQVDRPLTTSLSRVASCQACRCTSSPMPSRCRNNGKK